MFIVAADFETPPYNLPNLNDNTSFEDFVEEQEEEILRQLLGDSLYEAFIEGLEEDPIPQRWIDLRDGKSYTYNDKTYKWKGIKKMLKPFIYSQWVRHDTDTATGVGIVVGNAENSQVINSSHRIAFSWNHFSRLAGNTDDMELGIGNFYDHFYYPYFNVWYTPAFKNTLLGFLYTSESTYTADLPADEYADIIDYLRNNFESPGYLNQMGI